MQEHILESVILTKRPSRKVTLLQKTWPTVFSSETAQQLLK
jgi:hypothetical protein